MIDDSHLFEEISCHLERWGRRRLLADALLWLPRGLLAGLVAAAAVAALARFRPVLHNREVAYVTISLATLGLLASLIFLLFRKHSTLEQAHFFDRQFELSERLTTAVEIQTGRLSTTQALAECQLVDTSGVVSQVDINSGLPLKINRPDLVILVLAGLLLVAAVVVPNQQTIVLREQEALTEAIDQQIVALQALKEQVQNAPLLSDNEREELLAPIRSAVNELNKQGLSREQAVSVLSEAEADLRELSGSGNAEALLQALQDAGRSLADNPSTTDIGGALVDGDLAQAAQAANQLADSLAQLSSDESKAIARDLRETVQTLADVDPSLAAQLAGAAEGLQNGDLQTAQEALHLASATLQQRALEQARAAEAQAAADALQSGRQEVATAGSAADSSSSEGSTSATSAANGTRQAAQNGDGSGQATQGAGLEQGAGQIGSTGAVDGQGAGGPGPGGGHAESVYVPDLVDLSAEEGTEIELPAECIAAPENCGSLIDESPTDFKDEQSLVPYEKVFGDYRNAAFEALEGDYIPLGMKGLVRDYFSSLEP